MSEDKWETAATEILDPGHIVEFDLRYDRESSAYGDIRGWLEDLRKLPEAAEVVALTAERDELQQTFDLRYHADLRALKRWRAGHPERELLMPDHADMVVWLLERASTCGTTRDG